MNREELLAAFTLPTQASVNQRITKKLLVENGAVTAADKTAIGDGVEELIWVAALKPATVGIPAYADADRQYLEIAVLTLSLREGAKAVRLRELVHRAIPYPVVLLTAEPHGAILSLCELRNALNEAGKCVLDGDVLATDPTPIRERLSLAQQPTTNLATVYRSWCDALRPLIRRQSQFAEIESLRRLAEKEPQIAKRIEMNLRIQSLTADANR